MRAPVPICKWLHAVLRRGAPPLLGRWGALPGTPTTGNFPLAPHPFHVQVTVTLSPHLLAPLCSWFFTRFLCNPEQSLGNGKPEAALLHGSLCWGHWSILNLALGWLHPSLALTHRLTFPSSTGTHQTPSSAQQQSKTGGASSPEAYEMFVSLGPHLLTWLQLR